MKIKPIINVGEQFFNSQENHIAFLQALTETGVANKIGMLISLAIC